MGFRSLRSWILLSYTALILLVLFFFLLAALLIGSAFPLLRYGATINQLDAVSRASRNEIRRLQLAGADTAQILEVLDETAVENDVRVLVVGTSDQHIRFDSDESWQGQILDQVVRFETGDASTVAGLYHRNDNTTWLLYSRALNNNDFGQISIVYARPEPSRLGYIQELGLGRLLLLSVGITFLLAVILAYGIAASVSRPLQQMALAAEAIAEGKYEQRLDARGPEEVQRVADSFNIMSTQVAATRQAHRDFVANVSHDLKTPLTSIQGWSQALLDGTAVTPQAQQQAAQVIHNESERMARLVQQLLDLARIESGQLELNKSQVDLNQITQDVYRNLSVRAQEAGVHLSLANQPVPPIEGDADRLMQIFTNLVDNSIAHTQVGGEVAIIVHSPGEKFVEVTVQDSGKGIPPEDLTRVFERFYQVDKSRAKSQPRQGTGLGLAIVKELVQLHNGRIEASSDVGIGSKFTVHLPPSNFNKSQS